MSSVPNTAPPTPWGVFFVSSIAVIPVSMDGTLHAAFGAVHPCTTASGAPTCPTNLSSSSIV
jgi:hypothetical protein